MTTRQPIYKSLYFQVIVAIVIGILLGHFYPQTGVALKPLGDGFIKLIKMVIAPIIFCTVVSGIAGMQSMKSVGKTGGYALLYFEIVSTIALLIGLIVVNVVQPGAGMHIDASTLDASKVAAYVTAGNDQSIVGFILNIIPATIVGAFANGDILQVLMFSVVFGFALHRLGAYGKPVLDFIDRFAHVMFNIINMIMKLAPLGALGAMAFTIGAYGVGSLVQLGQLMICFYITCVVFVLVVLGAICRAHGFSVIKLIRYIREELLIVLGTSSSESALPRMLIKMERLGAKKSVVGLVIPTGYSFNLDGTCRCDGQWLHRTGRDPVGRGSPAGGRPGADPGYRPLHVRSSRPDQPGGQRRGYRSGCQVGQGAGRRQAAIRAGFRWPADYRYP
jgi:aerobic C4-dicarboxylate transport protein